MMKLAKRAAALVLAAVLALSLTACSPKEVASNLILKTADMLGLREEGSDDDEADEIVAQPGGEVNFPDGLQDTSVHWNQQVQDGTLYVAFNSIQNRNTEYFVAGSDTVQVTGYGTTESTGILEFKVALWELSEDKATLSPAAGQAAAVYLAAGDVPVLLRKLHCRHGHVLEKRRFGGSHRFAGPQHGRCALPR